MVDDIESTPINLLKIKSSHNSYAEKPGQRDCKPEYLQKILEKGFRSVELDLAIEQNNGDLNFRVTHWNVWGFEKSDLYDFIKKLVEFKNYQESKGRFDPIFIFLDFRKSNTNVYIDQCVNYFIRSLCGLVDHELDPFTTDSNTFGKYLMLPPQGDIANRQTYQWPLYKECKGKFFIGMHFDRWQNLQQSAELKFLSDLVHIDDSYYFENYRYHEYVTYREEIEQKIKEGRIMVRVYPPAAQFGILSILLNKSRRAIDGSDDADGSDITDEMDSDLNPEVDASYQRYGSDRHLSEQEIVELIQELESTLQARNINVERAKQISYEDLEKYGKLAEEGKTTKPWKYFLRLFINGQGVDFQTRVEEFMASLSWINRLVKMDIDKCAKSGVQMIAVDDFWGDINRKFDKNEGYSPAYKQSKASRLRKSLSSRLNWLLRLFGRG